MGRYEKENSRGKSGNIRQRVQDHCADVVSLTSVAMIDQPVCSASKGTPRYIYMFVLNINPGSVNDFLLFVFLSFYEA